MKRKKNLRWLLAAALVAVLLPLGLLRALRGAAAERWNEAEAHLAAHEATLRRDVQAVLGQASPGRAVDPDALPPGLRVPHLRFALRGDGHIDLVVYSSPDVTSGFRVWAGPRSSEFDDEPTPVADVDRFRYVDDLPSSASNRP